MGKPDHGSSHDQSPHKSPSLTNFTDTHHHYTTTPSPSSPLLAGTHDGMPLLSGPAHPHSPVGGHYNAEHHHQQVGQVQTQMTGDNSPPYVFDGSNGRQQLPVHGTMRGMGMRGCVAAAQSGVSGPNVVPLPLLTRFAAAVECPACRAVGPTNVEHKVGKGAQ